MTRPMLCLAGLALKRPSRFLYRDSQICVQSVRIAGYRGGEIELIVLRPREIAGKLPCLLYCRGGGFVIDASFMHYGLASEYAKGAECAVVMVRYRLAPQHPYPTAAEDCFCALEWVLRQEDFDPRRIAVGGDSAGGNLAAVTAQMARDRLQRTLLFQMLIYPVTDRRMRTASMRDFTDTPMRNARLNDKMWKMYLPTAPDVPAYASQIEAEDFSDLPPVYLETVQFDCLHDEGIAYADCLARGNCRHEKRNPRHDARLRDSQKCRRNPQKRHRAGGVYAGNV